MKKILAILAVCAAFSSGAVFADDEPVDCFYQSNSYHPDCRK